MSFQAPEFHSSMPDINETMAGVFDVIRRRQQESNFWVRAWASSGMIGAGASFAFGQPSLALAILICGFSWAIISLIGTWLSLAAYGSLAGHCVALQAEEYRRQDVLRLREDIAGLARPHTGRNSAG